MQTIGDLLGLGSSRKFIFVFIAIGALLLALAMRFGFPGFGSAAATAMGAAAAKSAVSIHTGPPPSFVPDVTEPAAAPAVPETPDLVSETPVMAPNAPTTAELPAEELAPIGGGGVDYTAAAAAPLEEVAFPTPAGHAPAIVPSDNLQEVEVLC